MDETVLVVEDELLVLITVSDELRDAGYRVYEARGADEAIRLLEAHADIRLVFTDIDMPGSMDGLRLSAVIGDRWPPVRIIVTSGKSFPGEAALPAGCRFLPKPYSPQGVLIAVRAMLS